MATVTGTTPIRRTETRRLPRTTGALSGFLVILLGIWGALIPFVGPYFHYAFGSYQTWHYTSARLWLCIVPGAVAVIGGLLLLRSSHRSSGLLGGWLALAAGAWFAIGPTVSLLWHHTGNPIGTPMGGHTRQAIELLGYFQGLGVLIAALSAFAMGRYYSRPRLVDEAAVPEDEAVVADEAALAGRDGPTVGRVPVEREAPVASTAAGEPVAAGEAPLVARNEPVAAREEPVEPIAAREEPVEPVAAREEPVEPVAAREDPIAAREGPIVAREEPVEPVAAAREDPIAAREEPEAVPVATATYRRRPGLSRFRRR